MSDFFTSVEHELIAATTRGAQLPWYRRRVRMTGPLAHLRVGVLAFALLAGSAAIALAASGVILTGSPVQPAGHPSPTVGEGIPIAGASRLLPLQAPDPAGGLPWGMRVVHTTRGLICVQIGRIHNGQLGELGVDGAFHDDGLFHPLPADILPDTAAPPSAMGNVSCEPPGVIYAGDIVGLQLSAASNPTASAGVTAAADRREISFGLLGPNAVSIAYRPETAAHTLAATAVTQPVLPQLGAYLIVQRVLSGRRLGGESETIGSEDGRKGFPASPNGALTAIVYDYDGKQCTDTGSNSVIQACGLAGGPPPQLAPLPRVHVDLHVHLQIHGHVITGGEVSFAAPYPVTSAGQSYSLIARSCHGLGGNGSDRDLARGSIVSIPIGFMLANACSRTVTIEVSFVRYAHDNLTPTHIGTITVHEPPGTHPLPLPARPGHRGT
jgi:hypothetical protein